MSRVRGLATARQHGYTVSSHGYIHPDNEKSIALEDLGIPDSLGYDLDLTVPGWWEESHPVMSYIQWWMHNVWDGPPA